MKTTQQLLAAADDHLAESMGQRQTPAPTRLAPTPHAADIGRRPAPQFGRIDVGRLQPDPSQPRLAFDDDAIQRLAVSLKSAGQLAPIRARWSEPHNKWLIVAGERRWRAAQLAGLDSVDCFFYRDPLDEGETLRLQLVENLLRENLKPIEEARGFRRLMQQQCYTGKQVAAELSVPESKVSRSLALLKLPEDVQSQVEDGLIAPRVAYEITKSASPSVQRQLASEVAAGELHLKDVQRKNQRRRPKRERKQPGVRLTFLTEEGFKLVINRRTPGSYYEVEQALTEVLEDVRTRIKAGVQIL